MNRAWVVFALVVLTASATWKIQDWRYSSRMHKSEAKRTALTLKLEREQTKKNQALAQLAENELNTILADERVIIREVVKYARNPNAGRCVLPNEWVQKADDSARMSTN